MRLRRSSCRRPTGWADQAGNGKRDAGLFSQRGNLLVASPQPRTHLDPVGPALHLFLEQPRSPAERCTWLNGVYSGCGVLAGEEDLLDLVVVGVQVPVQGRDLFGCG